MTEFEKQSLQLLKDILATLEMIEMNTASLDSSEQQRRRAAKRKKRP